MKTKQTIKEGKVKLICPKCGEEWNSDKCCGAGNDYMKFGFDGDEIGDGE